MHILSIKQILAAIARYLFVPSNYRMTVLFFYMPVKVLGIQCDWDLHVLFSLFHTVLTQSRPMETKPLWISECTGHKMTHQTKT